MINIITTHFGNEYYIKTLIKNLYETQLLPNNKLWIIDNSESLKIDFYNCEVLRFPNTYQGGENHIFGLNNIFSVIPKTLENKYLVLDSDILLIKNFNWEVELDLITGSAGALLAIDPAHRALTHTCFMYFSGIEPSEIDFSAGFKEFGFDTGRLIGYHLSKKYNVKKLPISKKRGVPLGWFYWEERVFHLGSASLPYMESRIKQNKISRLFGIHYRRYIFEQISKKFEISSTSLIFIKFKSTLKTLYCYYFKKNYL
jgi:hypothetical protein